MKVNIRKEITSPDLSSEELKVLGQGFIIKRKVEKELEDGQKFVWEEQWFVTQSFAHADRQKAALEKRLKGTLNKISSMRPKKEENREEFSQRVKKYVSERGMKNIINVSATETVITTKRYLKRGRPTANTPFELQEKRKIELHVKVNQEAFEQASQMAGWRVYVSNQQMT
ncbi:MAG: hypothetical protein ACPGII_09315, partial [Opitutales bacterium]